MEITERMLEAARQRAEEMYDSKVKEALGYPNDDVGKDSVYEILKAALDVNDEHLDE